MDLQPQNPYAKKSKEDYMFRDYEAPKYNDPNDGDVFDKFGVKTDYDVPEVDYSKKKTPQEIVGIKPRPPPEPKKLTEAEIAEGKTEEPPPVVEPYMTREYYAPGYVDTEPKKEYPEHIQVFKD